MMILFMILALVRRFMRVGSILLALAWFRGMRCLLNRLFVLIATYVRGRRMMFRLTTGEWVVDIGFLSLLWSLVLWVELCSLGVGVFRSILTRS